MSNYKSISNYNTNYFIVKNIESYTDKVEDTIKYTIIDPRSTIAFCINLDRDQEKYKNVTDEFNGILEINRISAIDGKMNGISGVKALRTTTINFFNSIIKYEGTWYFCR